MAAKEIDRKAALALVAGVEKAFGTHDIDRIMEGFTDDITVRFADQPEIHGKRMSGRGTGFRTVRDGKVALWEAAFSVWDRDAPTKPPCSQ